MSTLERVREELSKYEHPFFDFEAREKGEEVKPVKAKMAKPKTAPSEPKTDSFEPKTMTACPECGSNVEHVSGCVLCYGCGWSRC